MEEEELLFCICVSLSTQENNRGRPGNEAGISLIPRPHSLGTRLGYSVVWGLTSIETAMGVHWVYKPSSRPASHEWRRPSPLAVHSLRQRMVQLPVQQNSELKSRQSPWREHSQKLWYPGNIVQSILWRKQRNKTQGLVCNQAQRNRIQELSEITLSFVQSFRLNCQIPMNQSRSQRRTRTGTSLEGRTCCRSGSTRERGGIIALSIQACSMEMRLPILHP